MVLSNLSQLGFSTKSVGIWMDHNLEGSSTTTSILGTSLAAKDVFTSPLGTVRLVNKFDYSTDQSVFYFSRLFPQ